MTDGLTAGTRPMSSIAVSGCLGAQVACGGSGAYDRVSESIWGCESLVLARGDMEG